MASPSSAPTVTALSDNYADVVRLGKFRNAWPRCYRRLSILLLGVVALMGCSGDDGGSAALETEDYTVTTSGSDESETFASLGTCTPDGLGGSLSLAGRVRNESPEPHGYEITVEFDDGRSTVTETVFVEELQPGDSGEFYAIGSGLQEGTCEVTRVEQG